MMNGASKGNSKGSGGKGRGDRGRGAGALQDGRSSRHAGGWQSSGQQEEQLVRQHGIRDGRQEGGRGDPQGHGWVGGGVARRATGKGSGRGGHEQHREVREGLDPSGCRGGGRKRRGTKVGWLFVRNLPGNVRVEALEYVFANYGKVVKICVMNGRSAELKACAFIKYLFTCEAALAIQMLHGKYEMQPGHGPIAVKADAPGVFVENLPADIEEEMVDYVFSFYGQVQTVHITTGHSRSGRARAFVEYSSAAEAATATQALHETQELQEGGPDLGLVAELRVAGEVTPADAVMGPPGKPELPVAGAPSSGGSGGSEPVCVVCLAAPKTHAFVPCGHRCVCEDCGSAVVGQDSANCPICRTAVEQLLQIFC